MAVNKIDSIWELAQFARRFIDEHRQGAVVGLWGDLGAGKTTFVRECVSYLYANHKETPPRVISPTFVIHQSYHHVKPSVDHFDLYRIERADESALLDVGYFAAVEWAKEHHGFVFVEWPERAQPLELLALDKKLKFDFAPEGRSVQSL